MMQKIYNIGKYVEKNYPQYNVAYEDLSDGGKYKHLLTIRLKTGKRKILFDKVDYEEIMAEKNLLYLYKQGSPRGTDFTPCSKITKSFQGSYELKIESFFKKNNQDQLLKDIYDCLLENKEKILKQGEEKAKAITGKEGKALTLILDDRYIGELEEIKAVFNASSSTEYYEKYNTFSRADNKLCSVCRKKQEVYGFVNTYNFYTVNEDGMVAGGFNKAAAWKNYPVCPVCASLLGTGKNYINTRLNFNFYGYNYLLLPGFFLAQKSIYKEFFSLIEHYLKDLKLNRETSKAVISKEDQILDLLGKNKDYMNYSLLFYDAPKGIDGAVFNIILLIEDVYPSRLKMIFDLIRKIDKKEYLQYIRSNKEEYYFHFGVVREIYPYESKNQQNMKPFLAMAEKIFKDHKISYHKLLTDMLFQIRKSFKQGYDHRSKTLKFYAFLEFMLALEMFYDYQGKRGGTMQENNNQYSKYFDENRSFFTSYEKKVSFLMGILVQRLLNIQYMDKKSTPFYNRLKGLNLDRELLASLFPQAVNKLTEYGKNYYKKLESVIADYFVKAGADWKDSEKEISFAFCLGMSLAKSTDLMIEDNKEGEEKEENEQE